MTIRLAQATLLYAFILAGNQSLEQGLNDATRAENKKDYTQAQQIYERLLTQTKTPADRARILEVHSRMQVDRGNLQQASSMLLEALALRQRESQNVGAMYSCLRYLRDLAANFQSKKDYTEAERILVAVLSATSKAYGSENINTGEIYSFLGDVCCDAREYDKSIRYYSASMKIAEKAQGTLDSQVGCHMGDAVINDAFRKTVVGACKKGIADCYAGKKDDAAAEKFYKEVIEIIGSFKESDRPKELTKSAVKNYSALLRRLDKTSEAEELEKTYTKGVTEY